MIDNRPRIVVDTNVFVSYVINPTSTPGYAFDLLLENATLLASVETLIELRAVLLRPKFNRFTPEVKRQVAFASYVSAVELCTVDHVVSDCRDFADNKFLALALSGRAGLIVSGDEDLLVLHPWRSIPILSPAGYLARVG